VGSIIVILCHLTSSTSKMSLVSENINIDPIYIELDSWNVCTNIKEARSPQCIDDTLRTFYRTDSWTLVVQGCTYMIDTLADKTRELILLVSNPGIMSWLEEWKRQTLDMEVENKLEL
jgi:hypothetical protein